jgi:AraC-like DNA-binding protein
MYFNAVYIIGDTCWATSENGIWVSTGPREKAKKLFKGSPLSNLETYCIEKDLNGFIWVSSVSGLYRFKPGRTYYDSYLPSEEFNKRSSSRIRDSLYFGTIHGVIRLNPLDFPDKLPENTGTRFSKWVFVLLFSLIILIVLNFILWTKWKNATRLLEDQKTAIQLKENNLLEDLQEYIIQNITTVTVESMSKHVNMNPRTLYRIMEINYGMKPGDLIRTIKQNRIKELQKNTPDIDIVSLANQSGYSVSHIKRLLEQGFQEDED